MTSLHLKMIMEALNRGILAGRRSGYEEGYLQGYADAMQEQPRKTNFFYSEDEDDIIREHYPIVGARHTVAALRQAGYDRSEKGVISRAFKLGLKSGLYGVRNAGGFRKGHIPTNKGKKVSRQQYAKMKKTMFKAGNEPPNTLYDGAITIRTDSSGRQYKYIRLEKARWELYHRWLWKQEHGKIPRGQLVTFKDGDSLNCTIGNLELISIKENARRNSNREKFMQTCEHMTDKQVAGRLSFNDPELREELLKRPDILEAARQRIKLNREIQKVKS